MIYEAEQIIAILYCNFDPYNKGGNMLAYELKQRYDEVSNPTRYEEALQQVINNGYVIEFEVGLIPTVRLTEKGYLYARGELN